MSTAPSIPAPMISTQDLVEIHRWLRAWVGRPASVSITPGNGSRVVVRGTLQVEDGDYSVCCSGNDVDNDAVAVFFPHSVRSVMIARDGVGLLITL